MIDVKKNFRSRLNVNTAELVSIRKNYTTNDKFEYFYNILLSLPKDVFYKIWETPESFLWSKIMWCSLFDKNSEFLTNYIDWLKLDKKTFEKKLTNDLGIFALSSLIIQNKGSINLKHPIEIKGNGLFPGTRYGWSSKYTIKILGMKDRCLVIENSKSIPIKNIKHANSINSEEVFFIINSNFNENIHIDLHSECARMDFEGMEWIKRLNNENQILNFNKTLTKSLKILNNYSPEYYKEFELIIKKIVPLEKISTAVPSSSNSVILGTIFLTYTNEPYLLTEMLIHELSHNKLFLLQEVDSLIDQKIHGDGWNDSKFYSPWRSDKRPINGLFHGAFVFTEVTKFWYSIVTKYKRKNYNNIAFKRFFLLSEQLKIASQTLSDQCNFTKKGVLIKKYIDRNINLFSSYYTKSDLLSTKAFFSELDFDSDLIGMNVYESVNKHKKKWNIT